VIFVDTGAFLARYLKRDGHHASAVRAWKELGKQTVRCFTSNFVLDETFTLLARRSDYSFAAERARILYSSKMLAVLRPDGETELDAVDLFEKFADQQVSFTDCVSFALMRKQGLKRVFGYDDHFARAGFERWPKRA
jgi:predicted nucleic acid-binding protein